MSIYDERRFPLDAGEALGVKRHHTTLKSWWQNGLTSPITGERVHLECIYEGKDLVTSREAVRRFLQKLNGDAPAE
jgi:hypothetical protein